MSRAGTLPLRPARTGHVRDGGHHGDHRPGTSSIPAAEAALRGWTPSRTLRDRGTGRRTASGPETRTDLHCRGLASARGASQRKVSPSRLVSSNAPSDLRVPSHPFQDHIHGGDIQDMSVPPASVRDGPHQGVHAAVQAGGEPLREFWAVGAPSLTSLNRRVLR